MAEENDELEVNPLELSDEEMMNLPEPVEENQEEEESAPEPELEEEEEPEEDTDEADPEDEDSEEEDEATEDEDDADEEEEEASEPKAETKEPAEEDESDTSTTKEVVDNKLDYEAEYKKLLKPFRASGRDVQVNNVDEAVQLMQMGADYNKKMAGLKPSFKLLKMLENNELLDESKISYLIDLDKKNPEAITKLIKESGIDPLEVDVSADTEYKPTAYTVDDKQVELDGVLAEIEHSDSYANTIDVISNKWDDSSKNALYEDPSLIKHINDQMASGVYKQIDNVVQNQRMLGNLKGLSDMQAYQQVGAYMQQNSLFEGQTKAEIADVSTLKAEKVVDPKLKNRKKAAGSTKSAPKKGKAKQDYNPLDLSDEEFDKIATPII
jgi:hypothetical protein